MARKIVVDLAVMTVIGVVLGLLGPFGSYTDPLALRLIYWLGLSYAGYACYRPLAHYIVQIGKRIDLPEWGSWLAACLVASLPMATIVWSLGSLGGPWRWPTLEQGFYTYLSVLLVGGGITVVFNLFEMRNAASNAAPAPSHPDQAVMARFLERLPPSLGSELIALEMEDHYVRAHTTLGSELVLMRLRDAMAELDGIDGMQVHRSWWVARDAVEDVARDGRNLRLRLVGGIEAPVSRANVTVLKDVGWI